MKNKFITNDQAHNAARIKAAGLEKKVLKCEVLFSDGSIDIEIFHRAKAEFKYKTPDGEIYYQGYASSLFAETFFSSADLKQEDLKAGYENWLYKNNSKDNIISIKWQLIKD